MNNRNNTISFIKTDDNKVINLNCIRWIKKMNHCLEVCIKSNGCDIVSGDTHRICELNSPESYNKLNKHFE